MSALVRPWFLAVVLALVLAPLLGCNAVVRGRPLSNRSPSASRIYLSTGGSPRPFRTLGFVQISGAGQTYAGVVDVGAASFDPLMGALSEEAEKLGADAVVHIEFLDENPPTAYERAQDAAQSFQSAVSGQGQGAQARQRNVVVTGEIIQFIRNP